MSEEDKKSLKNYLINFNDKLQTFSSNISNKTKTAKSKIMNKISKNEKEEWDEEKNGPRYIIAQPNDEQKPKEIPEDSLAAISIKAGENIGETIVNPSVATYLADAKQEIEIDVDDLILDLGDKSDGWGQINARKTDDPAWLRIHREDYEKIHRWIEWNSEEKIRQEKLFNETKEITEMLINLEIISEHFEVRPNREGKLALFAIKPITDFSPRIAEPFRLMTNVLSLTMFILAVTLIFDNLSTQYNWTMGLYPVTIIIWPIGLFIWGWVISGIISRSTKGTALEFKQKTRYTISIGLASSGIIFFISSGYIETQTGAWNSILGVGALMILISGILKGVGASITQRIDEYSRGKIRE